MSTILIRSLHHITAQHLNAVVTIGNFDGVHRGHQALIAEVNKLARTYNLPAMVVTFEPHPGEFFAHNPLTRITRLKEKLHFLSQTEVNYVLVLQFNQVLANYSPAEFIQLLWQPLQMKHVVVGEDFQFGYKRSGNVTTLTLLGAEKGFTVSTLTDIKLVQRRISSTWVREAALADELTLATQLLGHPYLLLGRVRRGEQRGRTLGFPTANIGLPAKPTLMRGVYTVLVHNLDTLPLPGVANIGVRPSVDGTRSILEVHLLNFDKNIYGHEVAIEFCHKLRAEKRYPSLTLLQEQIAKDVLQAENYFNKR